MADKARDRAVLLALVALVLGSWLTLTGIISLPFSSGVLAILSVVLMLLFIFSQGTLKQILFYVFCFGEGLFLAPLISFYLMTDPEVISQTLILTTIITTISSWVGLRAKNLSGMGMFLFFGLLGYIGASIFSIFTPIPFLVQIGVALFTCYIAYDLNHFKRHVQATNGLLTQEQILDHVMNQFMNILNLFIKLLSLLGERD